MTARCVNPACPNPVPAGWDGGFCPACLDAMDAAETAERSAREAEEASRREPATGQPEPPEDAYERYGFDHAWEL